jgi:dipeptidyl aminopeptidase/acylaminoacyl peptidase
MRHLSLLILVLGVCLQTLAQVTVHEGSSEALPHEKYVQAVSEETSPLLRYQIPTSDGHYVAAAMRKPPGDGPFPAVVMFHGAPGGRGIAQLVNWSLGKCGGPVWERLLQEGYVVVVGDYRGGDNAGIPVKFRNQQVLDAETVLRFTRELSFVDTERVALHGVSLGGDVVMMLASRQPVAAIVAGAPATLAFLGVEFGNRTRERLEDYSQVEPPAFDASIASANVAGVQAPSLLLVGTRDGLLPTTRLLHEQLVKGGKSSRLEIYKNGYHDFPLGPQCHDAERFPQPLIDSTLNSLELTLGFLEEHLKGR